MSIDTAIYALTAKGAQTARKIAEFIPAHCFVLQRYAGKGDVPFTSLSDTLADKFSVYNGHIFVAASGIVVRSVAPFLKSKAEDPAVVVLDQDGRFAISLISGHLGGANELARMLADRIGATPVITTATDCAGVPSIDLIARENGLVIGDISLIKHINSALLDGNTVPVYDPENFLSLQGLDDFFYRVSRIGELRGSSIVVDWRTHVLPEKVLPLYPQCLTLGVGCRRGVPAGEILEHIRTVLSDNGIASRSISCMGTIDAKADEPGLIEAAEVLGLELKFFSAAELDEIKVANPSGLVMKHMGVGGVCEAAAMKLAEATGLLVSKSKSARVTVALARAVSR